MLEKRGISEGAGIITVVVHRSFLYEKEKRFPCSFFYLLAETLDKILCRHFKDF